MAEFHIRTGTVDDDLDAFGRIVLASNLALPGMPRDPDYEEELADVAARVSDSVVLGAFVGERPAGCVTFVADRIRAGDAIGLVVRTPSGFVSAPTIDSPTWADADRRLRPGAVHRCSCGFHARASDGRRPM